MNLLDLIGGYGGLLLRHYRIAVSAITLQKPHKPIFHAAYGIAMSLARWGEHMGPRFRKVKANGVRYIGVLLKVNGS